MHLERLALIEPDVYLQRPAPDRFNISDIVARITARPAGEPHATAEILVVSGGRVRLDDEAVEPSQRWLLKDLAVEAHDVATVADVADGRGWATFVVAGAPGRITVERLGVRPATVRATVQLEGLDLTGVAAYALPGEGPVRIAGGRFTTNLTIDYDEAGAWRAGGSAMVDDLALVRRGVEAPVLTVPSLSLVAEDVVVDDGDVGGRVALAADRLDIFDATALRPRPVDGTDLRAVWQGRRDQPGQLKVSADLPHAAAGWMFPARWRSRR